MKVLKFGGSSVANSKALSNVINIIKQNKNHKIFLVFSALGGVTDILLEMLYKAIKKDKSFKTFLSLIEEKHLEPIQKFIPFEKQSELISFLKSKINEIEDLLTAISMINEDSDTIQAKVLSYGEILSSHIIHKILLKSNIDVKLLDAKTLIKTKYIKKKEKSIYDVRFYCFRRKEYHKNTWSRRFRLYGIFSSLFFKFRHS